MSNLFYGNQRALQTLTAAVQGGRLCHAYLIEGEDGTGKTVFAKLFAAAILCTGKGEKPCGICNACYKTACGSHPDLHLYQEESKNKVDSVRKIKQDVYTLPNDGDYKVYLICRVEELTTQAQNALLKMLEEPPEDTVFLLTCRNRSALAATVLSRCVPIVLNPTDEAVCEQALLDDSIDPETAARLAKTFHGNIGRAKEAAQNTAFEQEQKAREAILAAISWGSEYQLLKSLSVYENKKAADPDLNGMLDAIIQTARDLLALKSGGTALTGPFPETAKKMADTMTADQGIRLIELVQAVKERLKIHPNLPLTLMDLGGKIKQIIS